MNKVEFGKLEDLEYSVNEAYKTLRTNLSFCGNDVKTILLTSCTPNEGKSTVALRLTQALAEDEKKVILVDADLRKSVFIGRYGITSEHQIKGLSHYLSGQNELDDVICETGIENLNIIFAGPTTPNPTELIGNSYFEEMIKTLREQYDYIIIDAPPLGSVIDAAIITKVCDGTILVVENNVISRRFAQDGIHQRPGLRIFAIFFCQRHRFIHGGAFWDLVQLINLVQPQMEDVPHHGMEIFQPPRQELLQVKIQLVPVLQDAVAQPRSQRRVPGGQTIPGDIIFQHGI